MNGSGWFDEVRDAVRALARRPVYSFLATTILTLGLSAAIGVFTYANGFLQPFPGVNPDGLVQLFDGSDENPFGIFSYLDYRDYADGSTESFSDLAEHSQGQQDQTRSRRMAGPDPSRRLASCHTSRAVGP